jgi:bifunctional non-homologous end joining protein LigD
MARGIEICMPNGLTKVDLTNLDKVMYPAFQLTKSQVIKHYIRAAPAMLPLVADRPVILNRYPNGVNEASFYEKDIPKGAPEWVKTFRVYAESAKRNIDYVLCNDLDTLIWMANLAALEIHMCLSRVTSFENPDLILFDLDPQPPASIEQAVEVATLLKDALDDLGLRSYVKTSGKRGLHVIVPIIAEHTFQQTRDFVHNIGRHLSRKSGIVASEIMRTKKPGTVYIDYLQNSRGRTMVAPYSLRANANASVSMPIDWSQVREGLMPDEFTLLTVSSFRRRPWQYLLEKPQKLEVNSNGEDS